MANLIVQQPTLCRPELINKKILRDDPIIKAGHNHASSFSKWALVPNNIDLLLTMP